MYNPYYFHYPCQYQQSYYPQQYQQSYYPQQYQQNYYPQQYQQNYYPQQPFVETAACSYKWNGVQKCEQIGELECLQKKDKCPNQITDLAWIGTHNCTATTPPECTR